MSEQIEKLTFTVKEAYKATGLDFAAIAKRGDIPVIRTSEAVNAKQLFLVSDVMAYMERVKEIA